MPTLCREQDGISQPPALVFLLSREARNVMGDLHRCPVVEHILCKRSLAQKGELRNLLLFYPLVVPCCSSSPLFSTCPCLSSQPFQSFSSCSFPESGSWTVVSSCWFYSPLFKLSFNSACLFLFPCFALRQQQEQLSGEQSFHPKTFCIFQFSLRAFSLRKLIKTKLSLYKEDVGNF